ncbi:hypothetical protein [Noviherbaspirillum soli]|uniref:hypothetical protein n=1 Tax=Noviherbaspirillum soli TaxID=1064518 RepID=UPI001889D9F4|nr:hypothetical protein [Noviherbaspirillum soli]
MGYSGCQSKNQAEAATKKMKHGDHSNRQLTETFLDTGGVALRLKIIPIAMPAGESARQVQYQQPRQKFSHTRSLTEHHYN